MKNNLYSKIFGVLLVLIGMSGFAIAQTVNPDQEVSATDDGNGGLNGVGNPTLSVEDQVNVKYVLRSADEMNNERQSQNVVSNIKSPTEGKKVAGTVGNVGRAAAPKTQDNASRMRQSQISGTAQMESVPVGVLAAPDSEE